MRTFLLRIKCMRPDVTVFIQNLSLFSEFFPCLVFIYIISLLISQPSENLSSTIYPEGRDSQLSPYVPLNYNIIEALSPLLTICGHIRFYGRKIANVAENL